MLLYQTTSHAELEDNLSSEDQAFELLIPENSSYTMEEKEEFSTPLESLSLLSVKAEIAGGLIYSFFPLFLEFQTPIIMKSNKLKWLIQVGAGGVYFPYTGLIPFFPLDTGLRYDFQSLTLSLKVGAWLILREEIGDFKAALSMGWNMSNNVHVELSAGLLSILNAGPFVSLSTSIPLTSW